MFEYLKILHCKNLQNLTICAVQIITFEKTKNWGLYDAKKIKTCKISQLFRKTKKFKNSNLLLIPLCGNFKNTKKIKLTKFPVLQC